MDNTLELLLKAEIPNAPEKELKMKRLSKLCGGNVIFTIRALTYSRVAEIKESHNVEDMPVVIVLAGLKSPDLKSPELLAKYSVPTPAELLKKMLLPGEIEDLSREVEKLSGYRVSTVEEIKKK
ncbi:hypothetical protein FL966_05860 [Caproiciproducens galactitolivorans]|uniref:Phage XkdN-like protein n=1 Tax=Caproiciproducens galactitolivorans TaxID=642589 RepID=A0A4Z0Y7Y2_9FIRM|nr:hypothetical protein [Caproiciproducens galactitolivorans]QEY34615.1 hypothetical protein FL966_05860 [Caproiciproducens galactitolivorans]TGJ75421.1 phage XkdN-like protein [Caproiciproducens galactitolivorans]